MGEEIKIYIVGPMPAQEFLDDFFPISELPDLATIPQFKPKCYGRTIKAKKEKKKKKKLLQTLCKSF